MQQRFTTRVVRRATKAQLLVQAVLQHALQNIDAQALGAADTGPQRLEAAENGGFDAMLNGAAFAAGGRSYTVTLIEGVPSTAGGESPPMPARLDVTGTAGGPDQPAMAIIGEWTCGP